MKTLAQDSNYDIFVDPGTHQLAIVDAEKAYAIIIADAIRTVRGELQLDTEHGVPYFDTVFKSVNGIDIWKSEVRKMVLQFPFVKSIKSFDVSYDSTRKILQFKMNVDTDIGEVTSES